MSEDEFDLPGLETISEEEMAELMVNVSGPQPEAKADESTKRWMPSLSERQFEVFFDHTPNLLLQSSRYTGKTWAVGYSAVKHAYDYHNALVLIVAKTKRQLLTGGLMSKLGAEILPDYRSNLKDFEFDGPKLTVEKDVIFRVKNRFGTWSIIQMMSIGNDNDLTRKIKGLEASMVIVDEIVLYETDAIYLHLSGVLGRRNGIPPEHQCFVGTCNPDSPTHWVSVLWSVMDDKARETGFRVIKFLPSDNPDSKVQAYYARLRMTLKNNPTQYKRDIEGLWVDVPHGDAIFKEYFVKDFHVRGDVSAGEYLMPSTSMNILIGWDSGDVNHGVVFLQEIITKDKIVWIIFDEVVYVGKKVSLEQLTRRVLERMNYWCEELNHDFNFTHISDRSAFDRFRSTTGSYDYLEIEKHSKAHLKSYKRLKKPIRILECPKPAGSVESRTRILMELLSNEEMYISARCVNVIEALEKVTPKKDSPFAPDTRSQYKHAIDAATYPIFYYKSGATVTTSQTEGIKPQLIRVGG